METIEDSIKTVPNDPVEGCSMVRSSFLFPRYSAWIGVARLFDFGQSLNRYNYSPTPEEADYQSLLSDWLAVGDDIRWAIGTCGQKTANAHK